MDKNTKIVPITLIINMNVEHIYFLRKNYHKKGKFHGGHYNAKEAEKISTKNIQHLSTKFLNHSLSAQHH